MINQKEAVYQTVISITKFNGGVCQPTKEQKHLIQQILIEGFNNKQIQLEREFTQNELKSYVSGLLNNWLRKDKRLNGGVKYQPKSERVSDPQLSAMNTLLSTVTDPSDRAEILAAIAKREAELKPKLDLTNLPEALRKFVR